MARLRSTTPTAPANNVAQPFLAVRGRGRTFRLRARHIVVALALCAPGAPQAAPPPAASLPDLYLTVPYSGRQVLILFGTGDGSLDQALRNIPILPPELKSVVLPSAFAVTLDEARALLPSYPAHLGDTYQVLASGGRVANATILHAVVLQGYSATVAAVAQFADNNNWFPAAGTAYLARIATPAAPAPAALYDPVVGPAELAALQQRMTQRMLMAAPPIWKQDAQDHEPVYATGLDASLQADPGTPKLRVQGLHLAAGVDRWFVAAEWDAGATPAFLMTACFDPGPPLRLLSASTEAATDQRLDTEAGADPGGLPLIEPLLAAIGLPQGQTAVLRPHHGYESGQLCAFLYDDANGLVPTPLCVDLSQP